MAARFSRVVSVRTDRPSSVPQFSTTPPRTSGRRAPTWQALAPRTRQGSSPTAECLSPAAPTRPAGSPHLSCSIPRPTPGPPPAPWPPRAATTSQSHSRTGMSWWPAAAGRGMRWRALSCTTRRRRECPPRPGRPRGPDAGSWPPPNQSPSTPIPARRSSCLMAACCLCPSTATQTSRSTTPNPMLGVRRSAARFHRATPARSAHQAHRNS